MRLHPGRLDGEVVGHEAVHAALHIWRLHQWFKGDPTTTADLGGECGPVEEAFAYASTISLSEFHAPHASHWPCHLAWSAPQSVHT